MASCTRRLKVRRSIRIAKAGKKRKNHISLYGSTAASLQLNKPNAQEKAVAAALAQR